MIQDQQSITERLKEWVRLDQLAKVKDVEGKALKDEANKLMAGLIEDMRAEDVGPTTVTGRTVSIRTETAVNKRPDVPTETFHAALRDAGLGDYIKPGVSASSLKGYVNELDKAGENLPEGLREVLNVHYIERLGHVAAAASRAPRRRANSTD